MVEAPRVLALEVIVAKNGAILQRRQRDTNGIVVNALLDAGPAETMRRQARKLLRKASKTIPYVEIDLQKMDELRTSCSNRLTGESLALLFKQ